ncbi:cation diffusion facilitator family transporter [Glacieibacterium sp.]|uniref:cation diffusion facilitator family transporter n=1 Tax=Glacieibacterium sp. TaxID=2860237 RepID=UPI003AFF76AB
MTERAILTRRAAIASVCVAIILLGLKAWGAWATESMAMLGSLADTALDLAASLVTLFAVSLAAQPADEDHRFGHGKAEAIAALMQTLLILGSALAIGWRAVIQLGVTELPKRADVGIGVSLAGVALTFVLVLYQRSVVRQTGSIAIGTDQLHYQSDLLLNLAVIAALVLDIVLGLHGADAAFGIAIAIYLAYGAISSASHSIDMLMDKEWPEEKRQKLLAAVAGHPRVEGIHELRTRSSGITEFIQFHIWLDPEMSVAAAHTIVDEVEARVAGAFPGAEILIHVDPVGHYDHGHAPG